MVNVEKIQQLFTASQNDMMVMVQRAKEEFFRPEMEREALSLWVKMPPLMREAIMASNPNVAKTMDKKLEQARKGGEDINNGIR